MRDPAEFVTSRGTPWVVIIFRGLFAAYFIYAAYAVRYPPLPVSTIDWVWVVYLLLLYAAGEKLYAVFRRKNIDMSSAFPLLLAVYLINLVSQLLGGQEVLPIMNRLEHFASFVLIAYVAAVFFTAFLPPRTWRDHPYYTALVILAITSLAGVANEIVELGMDWFFGTQHIGQRFDTAVDLLMNTLGSGVLLGVRLMIHTEPPRRNTPVARSEESR